RCALFNGTGASTAGVRAADAVDAPVPLNKAHRIPGHVQIDDIPALLEVDTFCQYVSCHASVIKIIVATRWCLCRYWRKTVDCLLSRDIFEVIVASHRDHAVAID